MSKQLVLERQFQALASQNEILRTKAKKINQIQTYVNILMQSTHTVQEQLNMSNLQNKQLKNQIDRLMAEHLIHQKNYQHDYKAIETQFKRQINKKDQQIRFLTLNREKEKNIFQQTLNQSQNRSKNDLQRLKLEFFHIKSQYQAQIKKLINNLNDKSKDYQQSEKQKNKMKKQYQEQINNISIEINKLQRAYQQSQNKNSRLIQQVEKLSKFLQQVSNVQNSTKKQLIKKQEQKKEEKRTFQKKIRTLEQSINSLQANQKKIQLKNQQLSQQLQKLIKQYTFLSQKVNEANIEVKRLQRLLKEKDEQLKQLRLKLQYQQEDYKKSSKRYSQQLQRLEQELTLSNERFVAQKKNSDAMKNQIADLLNVIDKLQQSFGQSNHKVEMLDQENSVLFKEVQNLNKEIDSKNLQLTDLDQMYRKTKQNALILQDMFKKEKTKFQLLQKQNNQILSSLQTLKKQQKSLQQQQVSNIIERNLAEKRQLLESNRLQKQALIRKYELALKQKDQQAKNRLFELEDQITLMRMKH